LKKTQGEGWAKRCELKCSKTGEAQANCHKLGKKKQKKKLGTRLKLKVFAQAPKDGQREEKKKLRQRRGYGNLRSLSGKQVKKRWKGKWDKKRGATIAG